MTNKGTVGKTGEQLLDSISERLKSFPNISYMASKVQDLLNISKPMTGSTSASAGTGGFVPAPPAQATTEHKFALLGSDGLWHTQSEATGGRVVTQKTLNKNDSSQYITNEKRSYLLGSGSYVDGEQVSTVYDLENMFISSYKGPSNTSGSGLLQRLQDDDLFYYYSSYITYTQSGTRLEYVGNIINRFNLDDSNTNNSNVASTNEFLLGKYVALISNSAVKESAVDVPRAALVFGNNAFNAASVYKPYVMKVCGNDFSIYYKGQLDNTTGKSTHYIKSTLDTIKPNATDYKWKFVSTSGFLFNNALEVNGISNIPNLNNESYYLSGYGTYSSFRNSSELRFVDTKVNSSKSFQEETGLDVTGNNCSVLYKTSWDGNALALAKYEYPTDGAATYAGTYSKIKLASYLKLTDTLYVSTDANINGAINIWPQYVSNTAAGYKNIPSYEYSTKKNYKNQAIGNAELNFLGPYSYDASPASALDSKIKDGTIRFTLSANNRCVTGSNVTHQSLEIISNNSYSTRTILSLTRNFTSAYSATLTLDADIQLNNTGNILGAAKINCNNVNASTYAAANRVDVNIIKPRTTTVVTVQNAVNAEDGNLYTNGAARKDLPVSEAATSGAQDNQTYYYRPIIVTASGSVTNTTIKSILDNAKNGYIWAYTG